jgi:TatD DNase family protein
MLRFFDSHCHPQLAAYSPDREEVLLRMKEQSVGGLVVGTDLETSHAALELAKTREYLWAAIGLHPNDNLDEVFNYDAYNALARNEKVVAIGECGLDFYRTTDANLHDVQRKRFEQHIALAKSVGKPLMIHCRSSQGTVDAQEEMLELLRAAGNPLAVMHFFTSPPDIAKRYLEAGCYLSFPGVITFTDMYDEVVRVTPLDRILSETDSPFATPAPHRGKRNEPIYVEETVKRLAELKGVRVEEMAAQLVKNAIAVFSL